MPSLPCPAGDAPAATPEGRREQLARELDLRAQARRTPVSMPRAAADSLGLSRAQRRTAQWRALARLARENRDRYPRLLAEESAAVAGGR